MGTAAIFWDRDNTLIRDPGYLRDAEQVEPLPGAVEAVRQLAAAGFENIIVTNQSGVARGLMDEAAVERIHERLRECFAEGGATIDAIYYCPYLDGPEAVVQQYRQDSDLRKPKPGMLVKASMERKIDLAASWSIGDSVRDAEAGRAAGCRTILLRSDLESLHRAGGNGSVDFLARSPAAAVEIVLQHTVRGSRAAGRSPDAPDSAATLQEILNFLRGAERLSRAEDFSFPRLAGAMVQFLAVAALIWALFGLNESLGTQIIRLLYALVLQLIALTLFVLSSRK